MFRRTQEKHSLNVLTILVVCDQFCFPIREYNMTSKDVEFDECWREVISKLIVKSL